MNIAMDVSVRELKNHLSEYLRRTQAGEEITIASRGQPVGRLVPPQPAQSPTEDEVLTRLQALPGIRSGNGCTLQGAQQSVTVASGTTDEILEWTRGG